MASSQRMMVVIIEVMTFWFASFILAYVGGTILNIFLGTFQTFQFGPLLAEDAGSLATWVTPFYYFMIIISDILALYWAYMQSQVVTDYYPNQGAI